MFKWKSQIIIFRMGLAFVSLAIAQTLIMLAIDASGVLSFSFLSSWGLLTLIPLANSARQEQIVINANFEIAHGDFSSITVFSELGIDLPCDVWVNEVTLSIFPSTVFNQPVGIAFEILPEEGVRQQFSGASSIIDEVLDVWQVDDKVGSILTAHPHFIWLFDESNALPVIWKQDYFQFVKGGREINFRFTAVDLATAPTTGNFQIRIEAKCVVVNYNRSSRRASTSDPQAYLTILARTGTDPNNSWSYIPAVDMRFYNVRMSILGEVSRTTFYMDDDLREDWNPFESTTEVITQGSLPQAYVHQILPLTTLDTVQMTNFFKGPFWYNKSDPVQFFIDQPSAARGFYLMQCEIMPDFGNRVTHNLSFVDNDIMDPNEEQNIFVVPWDMYLETIETDYVLSISADIISFLEIHVIKPGDTAQTGSINSIGGSILEWSNTVENQEGGELPSSVIDSLPIAGDFSTNDKLAGTSLEMVLDFVPAGSQIIVNFTGSSVPGGIGAVNVRVQLEGRIMVKSGKPSNFSYVNGEQIGNMSEVILN